MQVSDTNTKVRQIIGEIFGHLLGQRRDQNPFVIRRPCTNGFHEIVNLPLGWLDNNFRIDQARGANDLFDKLAASFSHFEIAGSGRQVHGLPDTLAEFFEGQGPVVQSGGKPETKVYEVPFPRSIPFEHATDLRHRDVRFVNDSEKVLGKIIQQCCWRASRGPSVDVAGVVFDSGTETDLLDHLNVVGSAHAQPLGLEQLALFFKLGKTSL